MRRGTVWILITAIAIFLVVMLPAERKKPEQTQVPKATAVTVKAAGTAEEPAAGTAAAGESGAKEEPAAQPEGAAAAEEAGGEQPQHTAQEAGSSSQYGTGVFFEVPAKKEGDPPTKMELLNEPVPEDCYMEEHADYEGPSLTWGLTYKLASAAQCCQACKEKQEPDGEGRRCNVWVYCPSPTGDCWSADIWNHTTGECWLKWQKDWDNNVDRAGTNLQVNRRGKYKPEFRQEHKTAPEEVAWAAGVIPAA